MADRPSDRMIALAVELMFTGHALEGIYSVARELGDDAAAPEGAQAVAMFPAVPLKTGETHRLVQLLGSTEIPPGTKLYTAPPSQDAEDAARYRWLRNNCGYSGSGPHNGAQVIVYYADAGDGRHGIAYTGPRQRVGIVALDAALDAARAAEGDGHE